MQVQVDWVYRLAYRLAYPIARRWWRLYGRHHGVSIAVWLGDTVLDRREITDARFVRPTLLHEMRNLNGVGAYLRHIGETVVHGGAALVITAAERCPAIPAACGSACRGSEVALRRVRLVQHPVLVAAGAGDPHEPRRERPERLVQGLPAVR
jgi:hypothetical protein